MTALAVFRMALWSGLTIVVFPHPQLMIWQSVLGRTSSGFTPTSPATTKSGFVNAEASRSVIFLFPDSVADCICCDDLSLVSAVSSISASVSALLLPALCLMCAPCIMTVVDFSCYGRSDSTRRPSLATLCKRRPGQGGSGVVVWEGWAWMGWIAVMMTMSALASSVFVFF